MGFVDMIFVRLPTLAIVDVTGKDAPRITNNLCTANVMQLAPGQGREAFVTEVRGKAIGHVCIFRTVDGVRMIGAGACENPTITNQAIAIAAHLDRYTIREQSVPEDRSDRFAGIVLDGELAARVAGSRLSESEVQEAGASKTLCSQAGAWEQVAWQAYQMPWWQGGSVLLLVDSNAVDAATHFLVSAGGVEASEAEFHRRRIENRFPWYGVDIDGSNLPQEADRDDLAISFTKGCYLGQETIARLDSLGQVQKKLVLWNLTSSVLPAANTELRHGDKLVGRLTSVAACEIENRLIEEQFIALGFARRSHFEAGSMAIGTNADGSHINATVSQQDDTISPPHPNPLPRSTGGEGTMNAS